MSCSSCDASVFSSRAAALTETVCSVWPTAKVMFCWNNWPTISVKGWMYWVANPVLVTSIVYAPGGRLVMW